MSEGAIVSARLEDVPVDEQRAGTGRRLVHAATAPIFDAAECDAILAACDDEGWRYVPPPNSQSVERHRTEQPLPGGNQGWIGQRLARGIAELNERAFGFNLLGLEDPVRVFSYTADEGGVFRPHIDLSGVTPLRKITFSLLLCDPGDFEGGDLSFDSGRSLERQARGVITAFPSYLLHAVMPVTAGRRLAIVGLVLGPTFV